MTPLGWLGRKTSTQTQTDIVKVKEKYESIKNKVFARENKQKDKHMFSWAGLDH